MKADGLSRPKLSYRSMLEGILCTRILIEVGVSADLIKPHTHGASRLRNSALDTKLRAFRALLLFGHCHPPTVPLPSHKELNAVIVTPYGPSSIANGRELGLYDGVKGGNG